MSNNQRKAPKNNDPILQAFDETKGEQLDLLDMVPEKQKPKAKTKLVKEQVQEEKFPEYDEYIDAPEQVVEAEYAAVSEATEEVWFTGTDGVKYTESEWTAPVVRNGPSRQEVEEWKERYGNVYFTPFEGEVFVWRTLQRPEYREIIRDTTLNALDREEFFTEKCVLFPRNFSLENIKKSRAGIASLLSEMIMDKSGFVAQSAPIKL